MVLLPILRDNEPEALPLVKLDQLPLLSFIPSLAFASLRVAVTVTELVALVTDAVYDVVAEAKAGDNVPELIVSADNVASVLAARVTVIVYDLMVVPSCAVSLT